MRIFFLLYVNTFWTHCMYEHCNISIYVLLMHIYRYIFARPLTLLSELWFMCVKFKYFVSWFLMNSGKIMQIFTLFLSLWWLLLLFFYGLLLLSFTTLSSGLLLYFEVMNGIWCYIIVLLCFHMFATADDKERGRNCNCVQLTYAVRFAPC